MPSSPASIRRASSLASASLSSGSSSGIALGLGSLRLLDDLLGDMGRRLLVVRELELEVAPAAGLAVELALLAGHLGHGVLVGDLLPAVVHLLAELQLAPFDRDLPEQLS